MLSAIKKIFSRSHPKRPFAGSFDTSGSGRDEIYPANPVSSDGRSIPIGVSPPLGQDSVTVPLSAIIFHVPKELHGKLAPAGAAGFQFTLSKAKVLEQLPRGTVKVPFGELRRMAPPGLFTNSHGHDPLLVDLPLSHILQQLRPEDYSVRPHRQAVEPPPEIVDVFGAKGECLAAVRLMAKHEILKPSASSAPSASAALPSAIELPPAPPPAPPPVSRIPTPIKAEGLHRLKRAPASSQAPVIPAWPSKPGRPAPAFAKSQEQLFRVDLDRLAMGWPEEIRQEIAGLKIPHVKCGFSSAEVCNGLKGGKLEYTWEQLRSKIHPAPPYLEPSDYGETVLELPLDVVTPLFLDFIRCSSSQKKPIDAAHTTEFFTKAQKAAPSAPPGVGGPRIPMPTAAPTRQSTTTFRKKSQSAPLAPMAADSSGADILTLSLSLVSGCWDPGVLREVQQLQLGESLIEVPLDAVAPGLKRGRIEFTWRQICCWLKPPCVEALQSPLAGTLLPLPLSVVAPLYLQHRPATRSAKLAAAVASIPDVFASSKPEPPAAEAPAGPPTPEPAAEDQAATKPEPPPAAPAPAPAPATAAKAPQNIAELFGEPRKRNWTPNEIVHKTVELPGVAGALIVLQDGLLVASCMPPGRKTETIAAFLPQIMGRMNQYAKEFSMGELESVSLAVEEGVMRIYNAGIIYFAALGRPDSDLPIPSLKLIAAELGRHTK